MPGKLVLLRACNYALYARSCVRPCAAVAVRAAFLIASD